MTSLSFRLTPAAELFDLITKQPSVTREHRTAQEGFTLVEAIIALLLMMVVALGSASLFSFSIYNNSGAGDRSTALAIGQEALEVMRTAEFSPSKTDTMLNAGTFVQTGVVRDGRRFTVTKVIDDNPTTAAVDVLPSSTLKAIRISVSPASMGRGWALGAGGTVTLLTQRSKTK
jgi:Tfp pilus assembly protein PilV